MPSNLLYIIERIEKKYLISCEQRNALMDLIGDRLTPDIHGRSTICSLYLDTPDFRIIRSSVDADQYKEKIRLRSYGIPTDDQTVFLELKKKYKGTVYKRRISLSLRAALTYLQNGTPPEDSQIMREINYAMCFYDHPKPAVLLFYERDAYTAVGEPSLRLTFDTDVRYRTDDLLFGTNSEGKAILPSERILLEIKTENAMPLWLSHALDRIGIFPTRFSKYGTAYADLCFRRHSISEGEQQNV